MSTPSYTMFSSIGELPCTSYPFHPSDTKGWRTVSRCIKSCRRQHCRACERGTSRRGRIRSNAELERDADIEHWDDVEHYGRVTYTAPPTYEHNGALFDIGSRF